MRRKDNERSQGAILLAEWRETAGLTLDAAADKLGCDRYMLNRYENGVHVPQGRRALLFKELCKVPLESWYY